MFFALNKCILVIQVLYYCYPKFPKLECCVKTACSTVVSRQVTQALPYVNHSTMWRSAVRTCVVSVHFCNVTLVLFCNCSDLLK